MREELRGIAIGVEIKVCIVPFTVGCFEEFNSHLVDVKDNIIPALDAFNLVEQSYHLDNH